MSLLLFSYLLITGCYFKMDLKTRALGPNEQYARWDVIETVNFDRRAKHAQEDAMKYVKAITYQLSKRKYAADFFEFLPAEPFSHF